MELTLRKANVIQNNINEMLKGLELNTKVTLNEFEDVQEQIDAVATLFKKDIELFGYEFSTDTPGPTFCKHDFSKLGS